ncbi:TPA: hypothetical protein ACGTQP_004673, partial [Salmonella enterica]
NKGFHCPDGIPDINKIYVLRSDKNKAEEIFTKFSIIPQGVLIPSKDDSDKFRVYSAIPPVFNESHFYGVINFINNPSFPHNSYIHFAVLNPPGSISRSDSFMDFSVFPNKIDDTEAPVIPDNPPDLLNPPEKPAPSDVPVTSGNQGSDDNTFTPDLSDGSSGSGVGAQPSAPGGGTTGFPVINSPGDTGGVHTPADVPECKPGSPVWPDCDDQSGQTGGGSIPGGSGTGGNIPVLPDSPVISGSGGSDSPATGGSSGSPSTGGVNDSPGTDKPSSGGSGNTGVPVVVVGGGSGGGHGSEGVGHGGGNTDGDGDALLQEVKRFHADVNAALESDGSTMPQFSDKDADFSDVQKDLDKQQKEQGEAWASGADKLKSTLGSLSGSLPSTKLDMSKAVPVGITGVCRPWEFDIVIGVTNSKQFKQHVVMTQFCTWYDTYIRPFVTWVFNFLTSVAVFNILYKGLRTIN